VPPFTTDMKLIFAAPFRSVSAASLVGVVCLLAAFFLGGCRPGPEYQDHFTIPRNAWKSDFRPEFRFVITDTAAPYQIFLIVRHTDAYRFQNIWVNLDSKGPGDSSYTLNRAEVTLAAPNGRWLGRGLGELYEQRVPVNTIANPAYFHKAGEYTLRLTHDMRQDPLPEILTVGIRLEKLPPLKRAQ
jgi:gliding motility-associated lipoprotein GldH